MQRNRHSYREADGDAQEHGDKVHVLLQEVLDLSQAVLGGERHPLQHSSSSVGGFIPATALATTPDRKGGKKGMQHCTAGLLRGQLSFFLLLAAIWEDKHLQYIFYYYNMPTIFLV